MNRCLSKIGLVAVFASVIAFVLSSAAPAQAALIAPGTPVAGVSQSVLAQQYTKWLLEDPGFVPFDQVLINQQNPGPVAFLPGSSAPVSTYNLTISGSVPLFFPLVVGALWLDDNQATDGPPCDTVPAADRFSCWQQLLAGFLDNPTSLTLRVDGVDISVSDAHRLNSGGVPFDVVLGPNAFGDPPGTYFGLFDGWWTAISPLGPGQHQIVYGFDYGGFGGLATANITVVPVAPTVWLLALGILGMAAQRRRAQPKAQI